MELSFKAFCTRCRIKKIISKPVFSSRDGKNKKVKGFCPTCGTKVSVFLPSDAEIPLTNK